MCWNLLWLIYGYNAINSNDSHRVRTIGVKQFSIKSRNTLNESTAYYLEIARILGV